MAQTFETQRGRPRTPRRILRVVLAVAAVVPIVTFRNSLFHGNFGVVEPGRVYRSAQPSRELPRVIDEHRLASILDLRGGSTEDDWYADELRAARDRGVDFYDLPMSATRRPLRRELLTLLDLFGRCRYPLLIHCKSGSDRTGLAAALYLMVVRGEAPSRALGAFSLHYGHVPLFGPEHLHEPIREYAGWLDARHLAHSPSLFRRWVERDYEAKDPPGVVPALRPGPRRAGPGAGEATAARR